MNKETFFVVGVMLLILLVACNSTSFGPTTSTSIAPIPEQSSLPPTLPAAGMSTVNLTRNPIEESKPIYGGILRYGLSYPRSFDSHQGTPWGPQATLPVFNQLVMFDINYKETVPETIIGDLAESWETSLDGMSITFKLHRGVKWHDGMPFTADDVIYSLDKMNDPNYSAISGWFPAYQRTEKIDEYTVVIHLKYPSAGFMLSLAQGESQIQALHLASADHQSTEFMVGTGPYILTEYLPQVHLKYKRNSDYWKKDQYGNQLPYLDGLIYYNTGTVAVNDMLIARRLDLRGPVTGATSLDTYSYLKDGVPQLLWQRRDRYTGWIMVVNTTHPPLNDIRIRRALGLVLNEEDLIVGFSGDVMFGLPGTGILHPAFGLPKEEVIRLMGWDKPYEERVAEAQRLVAEAGYPDGFKLNILSGGGAADGPSLVFADVLHNYLKIDSEINSTGGVELTKRFTEGLFDIHLYSMTARDPAQLIDTFGTNGYANYGKYSNIELDKILGELDHILDPVRRKEMIWEIDRILLTDLPALPTGIFPPNFMPYYPYVKNLRWNYDSYSNINRFEDIWMTSP